MPDLTLYVDSTFSSPYAMSCFVTMVEKKLDFALKTVNLETQQHLQPPFSDLAITARVPALQHGYMVLTESSAIIEYLEEVFPAPKHARVLPADVAQRAEARQVMSFIRSDLMALRVERSTDVIFVKPKDTPLSEAGRAAAERLIRIADRLISGDNLFGEWCIADSDLALMLNRLVANGDPVPERIAAYVRHQWQRDSIQQWVAKSKG